MAKEHYIILKTDPSDKNAVLILLFQRTYTGKKKKKKVLQINAISSFEVCAQFIRKNLMQIMDLI